MKKKKRGNWFHGYVVKWECVITENEYLWLILSMQYDLDYFNNLFVSCFSIHLIPSIISSTCSRLLDSFFNWNGFIEVNNELYPTEASN